MARPFLTARWQHLLFFNFRCPADLLQRYVPSGTELDPFEGAHYVSLVGFLFRDTLVRGIPIPCHRNFEEVNLRFYVRRELPGETRRAVVFLKELVPRRAIAAVARRFYQEPYEAVEMSNATDLESARRGLIAYYWGYAGRPYGMRASVEGVPQLADAGGHADYITEHYWGYTAQHDGGTIEYKVEHPRWRLWSPVDAGLDGDFSRIYGPEFGAILQRQPESVLAAEGSEVKVFPGTRIPA
ncbi:MAG TPA: DUF2071 domain-containing protein [Gemmatimonadales bacterium]|nr:DUF2071 domain-containing protein [Gemmatimonadales bacterium]